MKKVLIIGSPGSGKSTLAVKLGKILNIKVIHLDQLFWQENWVEKDKESFLKELNACLKQDEWIIDGCFISSLPLRLQYCDHVILLNYPTLTCAMRVIKRVRSNKGKTRPDMAENCPERFDWEFLKYVFSFKRKKLPKIKSALAESHCPITEIKSNKQLKEFLNSLNYANNG